MGSPQEGPVPNLCLQKYTLIRISHYYGTISLLDVNYGLHNLSSSQNIYDIMIWGKSTQIKSIFIIKNRFEN